MGLSSTVLDTYRARTTQEGWSLDEAQVAVARRLDAVRSALAAAPPAHKASALGWLFAARRTEVPKGLYVFGGVGRGKTMLMDLFFDLAPVRRKRRVHFHAFMADVHARIHAWRQAKLRHAVKGDDPIAPVAADLARDATLLCFDEFAVTDIADAMILGRLFTALFAAGVTVVTTSNVAPPDLYKDGLNRALFLPFIELLQARVDTVELASAQDYRLTKIAQAGATWIVPADAAARAALDRLFTSLTGKPDGRPTTLALLGRSLAVPRAAAGVARFGFAELVERPLGAVDFLALAENFHTVLIDGVRVMAAGERNVVKRFITLVDAFYDGGVKLVASAETAPTMLYRAETGREVFEFDRTASRLIEMQSESYLALPHRGTPGRPSGSTGGLVET
ncbi:cell division protein ZapE [Lichenihabitans sp. Uapishka_5]|uniref:cell division protein ZapE n=1 Tax=Lichenihabitans sp. Uapishka_5 TaxID=3037302 RepID=UPI0029E8294A|nr:cell division protein ZapE [Lichenihabitans sp. Uapishka_5]MDX7953758.1 cell division protein ZapE [Lichenihabitans sp. Uapishka_5]